VLALSAAGFGAVSWNYMQHDNGFCVGCHVMTPAFTAMQTSTVHDTLQCHDCHTQSIFTSAWQLYLWLKDRPESIEKHADVPTATCTRCHSPDAGDEARRERWQRVAQTAGHRIHLESDSSALSDVRCTTCHSLEVHRFVPADRTCGQSGCHAVEDTRIVIGPMANQPTLHCVTCHQYTAQLPQLASLDSARGTIRPGGRQCFSCHAMRERLDDFDPARDPHGGQCGMCHNPHTQTRPEEALKQCATSGCHADWRQVSFHMGANHRRSAPQCQTCHTPHAARVDASDCTGCHADVSRRVPRLRNLPVPFDTSRALRRVALRHEEKPSREPPGKHSGFFVKPPRAAAADSFDHRRHRSLACLTCHAVQGSARLTFEPPRGCQICHHQAPARNECAACHEPAELAAPLAASITVAVRDAAPRTRQASFAHQRHASLACSSCHTQPVSLAPADSVRACQSCHRDHHTAQRECLSCHREAATAVHAPPAEAHRACDACHTPAVIAALVPDRGLCLTCHARQADHMPNRECSTCHFLEDPQRYRRHLNRSS